MITNLLHNALKFSVDGGEIDIETKSLPAQAMLRIRDFGPGVPRADYEHVFERFWQGRESAWRGTGLGLYIARGLVEAHGGSLRLVDTAGQGSTFELCLPTGV